MSLPSYCANLFSALARPFRPSRVDHAAFEKLSSLLPNKTHREYVFERVKSLCALYAEEIQATHGKTSMTGYDLPPKAFSLTLEECWVRAERGDVTPKAGFPTAWTSETTIYEGTTIEVVHPDHPNAPAAEPSLERLLAADFTPREKAFLDTFAAGLYLSVCFTCKTLPGPSAVSRELQYHFKDHQKTLEYIRSYLEETSLRHKYWSQTCHNPNGSAPWCRPLRTTRRRLFLNGVMVRDGATKRRRCTKALPLFSLSSTVAGLGTPGGDFSCAQDETPSDWSALWYYPKATQPRLDAA